MSEIYFIRHGQASFGEENYDRLSDLGVKQAKYLARHLAKIWNWKVMKDSSPIGDWNGA